MSVLNVVTGYGAKGDFNPSTQTGTDDTSAFNAALGAAATGTVPGNSVYVPAGKYLITGSIGRSAWLTGIKIYGDSPFGSVLYLKGTNASLVLSGQGSSLSEIGLLATSSTEIPALMFLGYSPNSFLQF